MVASGHDVTAITLPALRRDLRARRIKMYRAGGQDQVAQAFAFGGWYGFERPLPSVFRRAVAATRARCSTWEPTPASTPCWRRAPIRRRPVHAFEPLPSVIERFDANMALNGIPVASAWWPRRWVTRTGGQAVRPPAHRRGDRDQRLAQRRVQGAPRRGPGRAGDHPGHFWRARDPCPVSVVKVDVGGLRGRGVGRSRPTAGPGPAHRLLRGAAGVEGGGHRGGGRPGRVHRLPAGAAQAPSSATPSASIPRAGTMPWCRLERAGELTAIVERAGLVATQV